MVDGGAESANREQRGWDLETDCRTQENKQSQDDGLRQRIHVTRALIRKDWLMTFLR